MIKNMKIKKSLILGFGVTIVVSVIIIIASIILMTIQKGQYTRILDSYVGDNGIVSGREDRQRGPGQYRGEPH